MSGHGREPGSVRSLLRAPNALANRRGNERPHAGRTSLRTLGVTAKVDAPLRARACDLLFTLIMADNFCCKLP